MLNVTQPLPVGQHLLRSIEVSLGVYDLSTDQEWGARLVGTGGYRIMFRQHALPLKDQKVYKGRGMLQLTLEAYRVRPE